MENLFRSRKSLFNPFVYIAGGEALLAGMAIIAATAVLAWLSNSWLDGILAALVMLVIVIMIVWMVVLMYNAFKVSANISGNKAGISFTIGIIAAYILSKITAVYLIRNFLEG